MQPDPLRAERSAFLEASAAAANAVQELAGLGFEHPRSEEEARALLHAVRLVAEKETDALAALDRFLLRCAQLGLDPEPMADFRRGRVELAESLGVALGQVEQAKRVLRTLTDG